MHVTLYKKISTRFLVGAVACFSINLHSANQRLRTVQGFTGPQSIAITSEGSYAYVTNHDDTVSKVDTASNSIVPAPGDILGSPAILITTADSELTPGTQVYPPSISMPQGIALTPDGTRAYVTSASGDSVTVLDLTTDTVLAVITGFDTPTAIAITPDGKYAYVTNEGNSTVSVIDTSPTSLTYNMVLTTPGLDSGFSQPQGIAITPDGTKAYVINYATSSVSLIDIPSNTVLSTPGLNTGFSGPADIAITPDGTQAYVTNQLGDSVSVITIASNTIVATPGLTGVFDQPTGIAITSDGAYAYVSNQNGNSVSVIDLASNTLMPAPGIASGFDYPQGLAITPNNNYVYVANENNNTVTVIYTGIADKPIGLNGCKRKNIFLNQIDNYNHLTWLPAGTGTPYVAYQIYRDAGLTQLAGTTTGTTAYDDHDRNPSIHYTYYVAAVDDSGNVSLPAVITVTQAC